MYIPSTYKRTTFNKEWVFFSFFLIYTPYVVFSQWTNSSSFFINWELIQCSLASFNVIFLSRVVATVLVRFSWIFSMVSSLFSGKTYFRALLASSLIGRELDRGIGFFWLTREGGEWSFYFTFVIYHQIYYMSLTTHVNCLDENSNHGLLIKSKYLTKDAFSYLLCSSDAWLPTAYQTWSLFLGRWHERSHHSVKM